VSLSPSSSRIGPRRLPFCIHKFSNQLLAPYSKPQNCSDICLEVLIRGRPVVIATARKEGIRQTFPLLHGAQTGFEGPRTLLSNGYWGLKLTTHLHLVSRSRSSPPHVLRAGEGGTVVREFVTDSLTQTAAANAPDNTVGHYLQFFPSEEAKQSLKRLSNFSSFMKS
jgi:hypothetical protein